MSRCPCCEDAHPQETPTYLLASQLGKGGCGPHMDLEEVTSLPQPSALLCIKWRGLSLLILLSLILDGGLHEHEDFYRLCSVCEENITFEPLLPRLPALARETQTPAPTMHPKKDRFEHEALKHLCPRRLCSVPCGSPSNCFLQSCWQQHLFPGSCPQMPLHPANPEALHTGPTVLPQSQS